MTAALPSTFENVAVAASVVYDFSDEGRRLWLQQWRNIEISNSDSYPWHNLRKNFAGA